MISFEELQLLLEVSIDQLRHDWVDSGKMNAKLFDVACQCAGNQSAYVTWLVKRLGELTNWRGAWEETIQSDHNSSVLIQNWNEWFDTFTKYKQYFDKKDINQYKTEQEVTVWVDKCQKVKQEVEEKKRLKDIDRFKIGAVEIEVGGQKKGYLVYKLPKGHEENRQIAIELGKTDHEVLGSRGWCTSSGATDKYWKSHINREDLYIFVNPRNRKFDKYQIQFGYSEAMPYWVGNDCPIENLDLLSLVPFYDFLHEKEGRTIPQEIENVKKCSADGDISHAKIGTVQLEGKDFTVYKLPKDHTELYKIAYILANKAKWSHALGLESIRAWTRYISRNSYYIFVCGSEKFLIEEENNRAKGIYENNRSERIKNNAILKYEPFYKFIREKDGVPFPKELQDAIAFSKAVADPEDNTMDIFKVETGIYHITQENLSISKMRRWIKPIAELYHLPKDRMLEVANVHVPSWIPDGLWFVSADEDGGVEHVKVVENRITGRRRQGSQATTVRSMFAGFSDIYNGEMFKIVSTDGSNRVLYERLKRVLEICGTGYVFSAYLSYIFAEQIKADKAAERERMRTARQAERAAAREAARQARLDARANGQVAPRTTRQDTVAEVPEVLGRWRVVTEGTANFYSIPYAPGRIREILAAIYGWDWEDNIENVESRIDGGVVGVVVQKGMYFFIPALHSTIDDGYMPAITRTDQNGRVLPGDMNPDRLYEIYKKFKDNDDQVQYPPLIQKIANIKEGRLNRFAVENIGQTSKLYMFSVEGAQRWIPYSFPSDWSRGAQHVFLGYINKWQFVLTDTGKFMLTGRWGSGGTSSWIRSVPGLSQTLIEICRHYNIPREGVLQSLQELCNKYGIEYPLVLEEELQNNKTNILFEQLLSEISFKQYKAVVLFKFAKEDKEKKMGAEKLAELIRAVPGATRVSTIRLDRSKGICIMSVRLISQKPPKEAFISLKENALKKYKGSILDVRVQAHSIEVKNFVT